LVLYQGILKTFFFVDVLNIFDWKAEAYSGLIWAFSLAGALLISFNENKEKQTAQEIQKQKLEIKALKAQINPHFLFNTLNNLMGTAISENAPQTSLQIQQLAGIMRHVVEETQAEYTPIEKEIKFLEDYIELMQLRVPKEENIKINVRIDFDENSFLISPLILITFIENAFKYGISINQACFVDILLTIENKKIDLVCKNSIVNVENSTETGLESVKKRLELTYPQKHSLEISKENNVFEVVFKLDLSHENPTV
jgi:LytS/YehU family sensor histidine kinase